MFMQELIDASVIIDDPVKTECLAADEKGNYMGDIWETRHLYSEWQWRDTFVNCDASSKRRSS